jgi:hypothetical protein
MGQIVQPRPLLRSVWKYCTYSMSSRASCAASTPAIPSRSGHSNTLNLKTKLEIQKFEAIFSLYRLEGWVTTHQALSSAVGQLKFNTAVHSCYTAVHSCTALPSRLARNRVIAVSLATASGSPPLIPSAATPLRCAGSYEYSTGTLPNGRVSSLAFTHRFHSWKPTA